MASPVQSKNKNAKKKKIAVRRLSEESIGMTSSSSSDEDDRYMLLARDSQWVGLDVCRNEIHLAPAVAADDAENDTSIIVIDLDVAQEEDELPLYTLFPHLKEKLVQEKTNAHLLFKQSTTDLTRLLVGQKPDFRNLKKTNRPNMLKVSEASFYQTNQIFSNMSKNDLNQKVSSTSLPRLEEQPNEERLEEARRPDRLHKSDSKMQPHQVPSEELLTPTYTSDGEDDNNDTDSTSNVVRNKKKTKKARPIIDVDSESSYSGLPIKTTSENFGDKNRSSHGSLADEESVLE